MALKLESDLGSGHRAHKQDLAEGGETDCETDLFVISFVPLQLSAASAEKEISL